MIVAVMFLVSCLVAMLPMHVQRLLALSIDSCTFQLVTYALVHGSLPHLAYNFALSVVPGCVVEGAIGKARTASVCGWLAALSGASHLLTVSEPFRHIPLVGFSGVSYGLLAYSVMVLAEKRKPFFGLAVAVAVAGRVLLEASRIGSFDFVAHAGHVGGALAGFILYGLQAKQRVNER